MKPNSEKQFKTQILIAVVCLIFFYSFHFFPWKKSEPQLYSLHMCSKRLDGTFIRYETDKKKSYQAYCIDKRKALLFFDPVPLNTADRETLVSLKGIGPKLADKILQYRAENGAFHSKRDLLQIQGIGEKKLSSLCHIIMLHDKDTPDEY